MDKNDLRIVFMGTPEFAVASLAALVEGGYNVVGVVTQPDRAVGRHHETLRPTAVKAWAVEHGLPVLQPEKMRDAAFLAALREWRADVQVVVAFRMLPEVVWAMPRYGTFNVHAALLPQYRGAAPINWAIINGETVTGVTTFFLDRDIDTGRIIEQRSFAIGPDDNVERVYDGLMALGAATALSTVDKIIEGDGAVESLPQSELAAGCGELRPAPKLFNETCEIDWRGTAADVHNFVRGLSPVPGAWTTMHAEGAKPTTVKIYKTALVTGDAGSGHCGSCHIAHGRLFAACRDALVEILELQPSGKKRMPARDFVNGLRSGGAAPVFVASAPKAE